MNSDLITKSRRDFKNRHSRLRGNDEVKEIYKKFTIQSISNSILNKMTSYITNNDTNNERHREPAIGQHILAVAAPDRHE